MKRIRLLLFIIPVLYLFLLGALLAILQQTAPDIAWIAPIKKVNRTIPIYTKNAMIHFIVQKQMFFMILYLIVGLILLSVSLYLIFGVQMDLYHLHVNTLALANRRPVRKNIRFKNSEMETLYNAIYRLAQQRRRSEQSHRQFFRNASEHLQVPLSAIESHTNRLLNGTADDPQKEIHLIRESGEDMTLLVSELLILSKMESDAYKKEFHDVQLSELLDVIIGRLREQTTRRKIDLEIAVPMDLPTVRIVDSLFERSVGNLLTYALKYADRAVCVRLSVQGKEERLVIEAVGRHPQPREMAYLFKRFYQNQNGKYQISLPLSDEIVRYLHGTLTIHAKKNGFYFLICLPQSG